MKRQEEQKYTAKPIVFPEDLTSYNPFAAFLSPLFNIESYNLAGQHLIQNGAGF